MFSSISGAYKRCGLVVHAEFEIDVGKVGIAEMFFPRIFRLLVEHGIEREIHLQRAGVVLAVEVVVASVVVVLESFVESHVGHELGSAVPPDAAVVEIPHCGVVGSDSHVYREPVVVVGRDGVCQRVCEHVEFHRLVELPYILHGVGHIGVGHQQRFFVVDSPCAINPLFQIQE